MKFGQIEIPERVFELARERMRKEPFFTPENVRAHIRQNAAADLAAISDIEVNQHNVAHRVARTCIAEMRASGEIVQFKHGTWARASYMLEHGLTAPSAERKKTHLTKAPPTTGLRG